jgi:hypothetical protein
MNAAMEHNELGEAGQRRAFVSTASVAAFEGQFGQAANELILLRSADL